MRHRSFKSLLSAVLAVGMLTATAGAAPLAAAGTPEDPTYTIESHTATPVRVWGSVTEKGEDRLTLKNSNESDPYAEMVVNITDDTVILDAVTGESKTFADLKEKETLYAYVGPAMTRSLPPIANGVLVLCNIPADYMVPTYAEIQSVTVAEDGTVSALTDRDVILHMNQDTVLTPYLTKNAVSLGDIQPGTRVLAWYSVVALSMPAQATPTKVMIFSSAYEGYLTAGETSVTLNGDAAIEGVVQEGKLLLPVRTLAEAMGCEVEWNNDTRTVAVTKGGAALYSFAIGGETVTRAEGDVALITPAVLLDGVTHVAVDDLLSLHNLKLSQAL